MDRTGDCICGLPISAHFDARNHKHSCAMVAQLKADEDMVSSGMLKDRVIAMKYTKRHYIELAALVANMRATALQTSNLTAYEVISELETRLISIFSENPRFNSARFMAACQPVRMK